MKVFVSHSSEDAKQLGKLKQVMSDMGIDLFLSHMDIELGENDLERIKTEISDCDVFLIIGNERSQNSQYCNQEIGMAIAHKKNIISTVHKTMVPWGFIQRQQAIKYHDIESMAVRLWREIVKVEENSRSRFLTIMDQSAPSPWEKELKSLEVLNADGFSVSDNEIEKYICLKPVMDWNDHSYVTSFTISHNGKHLGFIKIGFYSQSTEIKTVEVLPKFFPCLKGRFFSNLTFDNNLPKNTQKALKFLLNDINLMGRKNLLRVINEQVVSVSLFRDDMKRYEKLKNRSENLLGL